MKLSRINNYLLLIMLIMVHAQSLEAAGTFAYTGDEINNEVYVVDTATNTQIAAIPVLGLPRALAATPDGTRVYVACSGDATVKYIDTATNTVAGSISIIAAPPFRDIAITPDGSTAYLIVGGFGITSVVPIALPSHVVGTFIPIPATAQAIAIAPDGNTAYVTGNTPLLPGPAAYNLYPIAIPANTVGAPISLGTPVETVGSFIAISPDGNTAYISNTSLGTVSPVDLGAPLAAARVAVGLTSQDIAITPDGTTAYVVVPSVSAVRPLNLAAPLAPVPAPPVLLTGTGPIGIAITPDGQTAYTANQLGSNLTPLDLSAPLTPVAGAGIPVTTTFSTPGFPVFLTIAVISGPIPPVPPTPYGPAAPTDVTGVVRTNTFLNMTERILIIQWVAGSQSDDPIVSYNIYRGDILIGTVSASDPLCFKVKLCGCGETFFVAAVDAYGVESSRVQVAVQ